MSHLTVSPPQLLLSRLGKFGDVVPLRLFALFWRSRRRCVPFVYNQFVITVRVIPTSRTVRLVGICLVGVVSDELNYCCTKSNPLNGGGGACEIVLKELSILFRMMRFILFVVPCALKICTYIGLFVIISCSDRLHVDCFVQMSNHNDND